MFEVTPRWAVAYWLGRVDAPLLLCSLTIICAALWKALSIGRLSSKHAYLMLSLVFFLATLLVAQIAGARNMLQFVGVLCLATGALFDEAVGNERRNLGRLAAAAIILLAVLNLAWLTRSRSYLPYLATDGYQSFLKDNRATLREKAGALVYGIPILNFYAQQDAVAIGWDMSEAPWTTRTDFAIPASVKYALIPGFVFKDMPEQQPLRRIIADHWKVTWSYASPGAWELRLYEKSEEQPFAGAQ